MIEIIGEPRVPTEEELREFDKTQLIAQQTVDIKQTDKPEWQQRMLDNFLRRPKQCQPDCFGAGADDCGRCLK